MYTGRLSCPSNLLTNNEHVAVGKINPKQIMTIGEIQRKAADDFCFAKIRNHNTSDGRFKAFFSQSEDC